ncbi:uncharacterized protein [Euphorbia lathyris]|uniref:uncharacterized protein n=1 Tax=Euphorbia lathyris TaxID=212925 RepID=UPI00331354C0
MDYSLAALKVLCVQLKDVRQTPSQNALNLGGILFQRAWIQGIIVSNDGDGNLILDDGTGVIHLSLSDVFRLRRWDLGMYVMVVGGYIVSTGEVPVIKPTHIRRLRMDYSLAALKVLCVQLKDVRQTPSQNALNLGGILFQRAWIQGIIVSNNGDGDLILDDGTGVIHLSLSDVFRLRRWDLGMYVMVVGGYIVSTGEVPVIKVHKMVDLSSSPDREAMWYLEVLEAYKLFYQPLIEDFL